MLTQAILRDAGKQVAQDVTSTGPTGVQLLLTDPGDYDRAIVQALPIFSQDRPNLRVVDQVLAAGGHRVALYGTGVLSGLAGVDAWRPNVSSLLAVYHPWDVTDQGIEAVDGNNYRILRDPDAIILEFLDRTLTIGDTLRLVFTGKHSLTEAPNTVAAPTAAPTAALASPAAAGNVDDGSHSYVYTFVTAHGETTPSPASTPVTVADKAINGQVVVTIAASPDTGVTARRIYRTVSGDTGTRKLVGEVPDADTTTFTDNLADSGLGADVPAANTAGGLNTVEDDDLEALTNLVGSVILQFAANKAAQNTGNTNLPNDVVDRRSQSDIYRSRAKELRELYNNLVGRTGKDDGILAASAIKDLDVEFSDRRPFVWHHSSLR